MLHYCCAHSQSDPRFDSIVLGAHAQYAESLRDGTNRQPLNDRSRELAAQLRAAEEEVAHLKVRIEALVLERERMLENGGGGANGGGQAGLAASSRAAAAEADDKFKTILAQVRLAGVAFACSLPKQECSLSLAFDECCSHGCFVCVRLCF
jgi:hypothetical protein